MLKQLLNDYAKDSPHPQEEEALGLLILNHTPMSISNYFNTILKNNFPKKKLFTFNLLENLRYGENPHQESSIYINKDLKLKQLNGKKLSYNNYNDIFAALNISKSLPKALFNIEAAVSVIFKFTGTLSGVFISTNSTTPQVPQSILSQI